MKKIIYTLLMLVSSFALTSCESDKEEIVVPSVNVQEFLSGDIVLNTRAELNGIDKTILPTGCPSIFNFDWKNMVDPANEGVENMLKISMKDFQVGKMPFTVTFECDAKTSALNSWESDEYKGEGWLKFQGMNNGRISVAGKWQTTSGTVTGYFNVISHEIEMDINFNFMNVQAFIMRQTVDKSRIDRFEEEKAQYEKDLEEYQNSHK